MAAKVTDLFLLVKSLSRSEWSVISRSFAENAKHRKEDGNEMQIAKLLYFLKEEAGYDEDKTRKFLGYADDRRSKKTFSDVKSWAIRAIFDAIERAPKNQNPESIAQKIPVLIKHLINRGLLDKAHFYIEKYLQVCFDYERFDLVKQLLSLKRSTILLLPPPQFSNSLNEIQRMRSLATSNEAEIEFYLDLKETVRMANFLPVEERQKSILSIIEKVNVSKSDFGSRKAKFHFYHAFRNVRLYLRETDNWVACCGSLIELCEKTPMLIEDDEIFLGYIDTLFASAWFDSMRHKFESAQSKLDAISSKLTNQPKVRRNLIQERQILSQAHLHRLNFNEKKGKNAIKGGFSWYESNPELMGQKGFPVFAYTACEFLFLFNDFSKCSKILTKLRSDTPSIFHPYITCVSWLLTLSLRIETNDFEGLEYSLKGAKKYIKKYHSELAYPNQLIEFFQKFLVAQPSKWDSLWEKLFNTLQFPEQLSGGQMIENHFQFSIWAKSKALKTDFSRLIKDSSAPIESL